MERVGNCDFLYTRIHSALECDRETNFMARLSRQESRELTRQRLREAALAEFERHGVAAASIDRITEAAGYSRGAFYANYDSKYDLALELWSENVAQRAASLDNFIASTGNPGRLLDQVRISYDLVVKEKVWSALNVEVRLEASRNPEFRGHLRARDEMVFDRLRQTLSGLCDA